MNYLSVGTDAKTVKGQKYGYLTGILYLAPHTIAGGRTLCPFSTPECRQVCLYTAGRGGFNTVQAARIRKTKVWLETPGLFLAALEADIHALVAKAFRDGLTPAVRLNGTTDIEWEKHGIMQKFPDVQFYDYTKWPANKRLSLPKNYHLTYSYSEKKDAAAQTYSWFLRGVNTAVVFRGGLPLRFVLDYPTMGRSLPVINGDDSDLRFTDPKGVIIGLMTKGKARSDKNVGPGHFVQKGL